MPQERCLPVLVQVGFLTPQGMDSENQSGKIQSKPSRVAVRITRPGRKVL